MPFDKENPEMLLLLETFEQLNLERINKKN